jgi:hypothetical protein
MIDRLTVHLSIGAGLNHLRVSQWTFLFRGLIHVTRFEAFQIANIRPKRAFGDKRRHDERKVRDCMCAVAPRPGHWQPTMTTYFKYVVH